MSPKTPPIQTPTTSTQKSEIGQKQIVRPVSKIGGKELNSSCYRLSRPPQKFTQIKAIQQDKQEPWAASYFQKHPEELKKTEPNVKLEKINELLNGNQNLSYETKQKLLIRKKTLTYIKFGENSYEAIEAHHDIGLFYQDTMHNSSAIRHYEKAQSIIDTSFKKTDNSQNATELNSSQVNNENGENGDEQQEPENKELLFNKINLYCGECYYQQALSLIHI